MKALQILWISTLVLACSGIAYAESFYGTVTSVDVSGQNVTLKQSDTSTPVTIHVADRTAILGLSTGRDVSLQANRGPDNTWEAQTFNGSATTSFRPIDKKETSVVPADPLMSKENNSTGIDVQTSATGGGSASSMSSLNRATNAANDNSTTN